MLSTTADRRSLSRPAVWAGAAGSAIAALGLLTRYGLHGSLSRDEAIYSYAGQQLAHGLAPYASIFDPKGPGAAYVGAAAVAIARVTGHNELYAIRVAFLACAVATVVAVYLLVVRLFGSVTGGLVAAVVMASFRGFAADALAGPDAKTPGVLLVVLAMLLMLERRWFWAGLAASGAFLVWQPFFFYPGFAVVLAGFYSRRDRPVRAVGAAVLGVAVPLVGTAVYFLAEGAAGMLVEAGLVFPLTGIQRDDWTVLHRISHIVFEVSLYKLSGTVFWAGVVSLLVVVAAHLVRGRANLLSALGAPLVCVVLLTGLAEAGYAITDFQAYPDLYPLLPYAAVGLGGLVALVTAAVASPGRLVLQVVAVAMACVLGATSWVQFTRDRGVPTDLSKPREFYDHQGLVTQQADACALRGVLGAGGRVWAMGDPTPLVLLDVRNPDRYIYLNQGVDQWKVAHTPGGVDTWFRQVQRVRPAAIVVHVWTADDIQTELVRRLEQEMGYHRRFLGEWRVYVDDAAMRRARARGIVLARTRQYVARTSGGRRVPAFTCPWR